MGHPSPLFWWERGVERHLRVWKQTLGETRVDRWVHPEKAIFPIPTTANGESVDLGKSFEKYWGGDVKDKRARWRRARPSVLSRWPVYLCTPEAFECVVCDSSHM